MGHELVLKNGRRVTLPSYDELLQRTDAPAGAAWGLFGQDDELGIINLLLSVA